jgi:hypothetical protein
VHRIIIVAMLSACTALGTIAQPIDDYMLALRLWRIPSAIKHCKHGLTEKQVAAALVVVVKGSSGARKDFSEAGRALFEEDFAKDPKGACDYALPKPFLRQLRSVE